MPAVATRVMKIDKDPRCVTPYDLRHDISLRMPRGPAHSEYD